MRYYTKKNNTLKINFFNKPLLVIISIFIILNTGLYYLDRSLFPALCSVSQEEIKAGVTNIVYENSLEIYSSNFKYNDIVTIEKDDSGKITAIRTDSIKMNSLSGKLITKCNSDIKDYGEIGVKIPLGYVSKNVLLHNLGPKIKVQMTPIGHVEATYDSVFESAGINQTRHRIYLSVKAKMRVVVPLDTQETEVVCQIPIAETIIVGDIPDAAINWKP